METVLISTYELGHPPFGLASPAAWLRAEGLPVAVYDTSRQTLDEEAVKRAGLVACHVPMHTATRLTARLLPRLRTLNPRACICCYGLYAPLNAAYLRGLGADVILGGEFEADLLQLALRLRDGTAPAAGFADPRTPAPPAAGLPRQRFQVPDRAGLPPLSAYSALETAAGPRLIGYTEATRGCKHHCRHCPIVPVYEGQFRVVQPEIVLADIRQQVAAGAQHISFGDPDFFNGPAHALRIVGALHAEFPEVTYDATIKVEHLLAQARHLPTLRATGCVLVTSAVESFDDRVLAILNKGHSRADLFRLAPLMRAAGLALHPTFVPFTPWTRAESYFDLLRTLAELDLAEAVAPVQLGIRLLLPNGSRLLGRPELTPYLEGFDAAALSFRWRHPDPAMEELCDGVQRLLAERTRAGWARRRIFAAVWERAAALAGSREPPPETPLRREPIPHLTEPWFCCSEPTEEQFARAV